MKTAVVLSMVLALTSIGCSHPIPVIQHDKVAVVTTIQLSPVEQMIQSVPLVFYNGGIGSGVLFKSDGKIGMITAAHCICDRNATAETADTYGTKTISVIGYHVGKETIQYGRTAKLIAIDPIHDWAVLSIETPADGMSFVEFSASLPTIGESVWCVGSPLGDAGSISRGIICHPWRTKPTGLNTTAPFLHTDAAGTFGNSGGALFNDKGVCIGIVLRKHPTNDTMYAISSYLLQEDLCSLLLGVDPMPLFVP